MVWIIHLLLSNVEKSHIVDLAIRGIPVCLIRYQIYTIPFPDLM